MYFGNEVDDQMDHNAVIVIQMQMFSARVIHSHVYECPATDKSTCVKNVKYFMAVQKSFLFIV